MSGVGIFINLLFCFCFYFTLLFSEKKEQFLQVTRHVNPMNLLAQMASASHTHGIVILMMTAVISLMKPSVVSVFYYYLCALVLIYSQQQLFSFLCTSGLWESSHVHRGFIDIFSREGS